MLLADRRLWQAVSDVWYGCYWHAVVSSVITNRVVVVKSSTLWCATRVWWNNHRSANIILLQFYHFLQQCTLFYAACDIWISSLWLWIWHSYNCVITPYKRPKNWFL